MSFIKTILTSPLYESQGMLHRELSCRAAYLVGELKKDQSLVRGVRIVNEMRDAPDQQQYPLTRRQVEKLLARYERREDTSTDFANPEARSVEGAKRARWYAPEHNSDFVDDADIDGVALDPNHDQRPAKLMPYDYYFDVSKKTDVEDGGPNDVNNGDSVNDEEDWEGETNKFFMESAEEAAKNVVELLHDSTKKAYPVEFHLDDGSYVSVHPQQAQHILNSGRASDILNHIKSASHFQTYLDDVFDKSEGVGHEQA